MILDIFVLILFLYFGFTGFRNGLMREVLGISGVVVGLFLAFRYLDPFNQFLINLTGVNDMYSPLIAFALIFLGIILATHLIIISLEYVIEFAFLSTTNRVLGMGFGILKSSIFISIILILLSGFEIPGENTRRESLLYPHVYGIAPITYNIIGAIYPGSQNFYESIQKTLDEYHIEKFR